MDGLENTTEWSWMTLIVSRDPTWDGDGDAPLPRFTKFIGGLSHFGNPDGPGSVYDWLQKSPVLYKPEEEEMVMLCPGQFWQARLRDGGALLAALLDEHRFNATTLRLKIVQRPPPEEPPAPTEAPQPRTEVIQPHTEVVQPPDSTHALGANVQTVQNSPTETMYRFFAQTMPPESIADAFMLPQSDTDRMLACEHFLISSAALKDPDVSIKVAATGVAEITMQDATIMARGASVLQDAMVGLFECSDEARKTRTVLMLIWQHWVMNGMATSISSEQPGPAKGSHYKKDDPPGTVCTANKNVSIRCLCGLNLPAYLQTPVSDSTLVLCASREDVRAYLDALYAIFAESTTTAMCIAVLGPLDERFSRLVYSVSLTADGYIVKGRDDSHSQGPPTQNPPAIIFTTLVDLPPKHNIDIGLLVVDESAGSMVTNQQFRESITAQYIVDVSEPRMDDPEADQIEKPVRILFVNHADWKDKTDFTPYYLAARTQQHHLWSHIQQKYYGGLLGSVSAWVANALSRIHLAVEDDKDTIVFSEPRSHEFRELACRLSIDDRRAKSVDLQTDIKNRFSSLTTSVFRDERIVLVEEEEKKTSRLATANLKTFMCALLDSPTPNMQCALGRVFRLCQIMTTLPKIAEHLSDTTFKDWQVEDDLDIPLAAQQGFYAIDLSSARMQKCKFQAKHGRLSPLSKSLGDSARMAWLQFVVCQAVAFEGKNGEMVVDTNNHATLVVLREEFSAVVVTEVLDDLFKDYKVLWLPEHFTEEKRAFLFNTTIDKYKIHDVEGPDNDTEITMGRPLAITATLSAIVSLEVNLSMISKCIFFEPAYDPSDELKLASRITSSGKGRCHFFRPCNKEWGVEEAVRLGHKRRVLNRLFGGR